MNIVFTDNGNLLSEVKNFVGNGLTSEERAKVNTAIRNIRGELSEVDRYNWKEKLPEIALKNNLGGVAICIASSIVRQGFESKKIQGWASEILDKWKWADKERIDKSAFRPQGHRTVIWDMAEEFIKMTSNNLEQMKEDKLGNIENREEYQKAVAKMILDSDYDHDVFFEKYTKRYGIVDTQDKKTFSEAVDAFRQDIEDKDFFSAYMRMDNSNSTIFIEAFDDEDFMKAVIKVHGADPNSIRQAVESITERKDETVQFAACLLNETLNSPEYREAFNKGTAKTQERTM